MAQSSADRNLLFGILAVQMDLVSRDGLIAGMNAWVLDKNRSLSEILVELQHLQVEHRDLIESLVAVHLQQHGNDPEKCLSALSTVMPVGHALKEIAQADPDVAASLQYFAPTVIPQNQQFSKDQELPDEPSPTITAGTSTSLGTRYVILRPHAKGGLGQVSVALDQELNREVALKEIQEKYADRPDSRERFVLEAEVTGGLEHPGIVPVYGLGQYDDGRPFYAMRFIRGDSLKEAIAAFHQPDNPNRRDPGARQLELRKLLGRFIDVCNAIEYAHSRGVLHRDLKPGNVMLGKFGETLVVDWGLAKVVGRKDAYAGEATLRPSSALSSSGQTLAGSAVGTPAYMSPEQAAGRLEELGPTTDVYSLGATLYHVLTGTQPFKGSTHEVLSQVQKGTFLRPRQVAPKTNTALEAICLKAMSLNAVDRYATPRALADDIEHWLADEPVTALPETRVQRLARWVRRHRAWAQAAAVLLVLVSIVSIVAALVVNRAREQELAARIEADNALVAEQAAKSQALRMFGEARQAIDTWQTGVSEVLKNYPNVQRARQRLLEKAAEDYVRLAREQSNAPELQMESALAFVRLGDVRRELSQFQSAEQAYASAEAIFDTLSRKTRDPDSALQLANSQARLGSVRGLLGREALAKTSLEQAVGSLGELAERHPQSAAYRQSQAAALVDLAVLLTRSGDLIEAASRAREAVALYEAARHKGSPRSLSDLAAARTTLGEILANLGRTGEAIPLLKQAIVAFDKAVAADPDSPKLLEDRAAARIHFANALRVVGRENEELAAYRAAMDDYRLLLKALPDVPVYRENLALTRTDLAQLLHGSGRNREARDELKGALQEFTELFQFLPGVPRYQEEQAVVLSVLGRVLMELDENADSEAAFRDALKLYDVLVTSFPDVPEYTERRGISRSALARLLYKLSQSEGAREMFQKAIADFREARRANPDSIPTRDGLAACLVHFGNFQWNTGDREPARGTYREALALRETLVTEPEHLCHLAGLLSNCLDPELRDPARAVQVAEQATKAAPQNPSTWSALGVARYRAESWDASIQALDQAIGLRSGDRSADSFWLAMAQFRAGKTTDAKAAFDQALAAMQSNRPGDPELMRLRDEAAEVLGISASKSQ